MGIPKFFRWISERYPLCSELVQESSIPEFDNLYLDMNGIIHNCSHPNDDDSTFRITEVEIFRSVFGYIDHLFTIIKPRKLFFLAVDGVAPRAKMNQQRSRRFRSALDAERARDKARERGIELPDTEPFDSNCITPGTVFMNRLNEQLKYFITKKINQDSAWRGIQVVLSGHDVPGEGEHKIMEYIRLAKSNPDYPPNLRHCIYGLDADLMMLGLLSHEPHFSLLREEIKYGRRKSSGRSSNPDTINFYLLHLSLIREYLDLEFASLRDSLPFEYDLERIIDDYILLNFFVGNDFLPNLPDLHIRDGALTDLFDAYKRILPVAGGYINDAGVLNLERCQLVFNELAKDEMERFRKSRPDSNQTTSNPTPSKGRKNRRSNGAPASSLTITPVQRGIFELVRDFVILPRTDDGLVLDAANMSMADREFAMKLATDLGLDYSVDISHLENGDVAYFIEVNWKEDDEDDDEESLTARNRVLRKYENANVKGPDLPPPASTNSDENGASNPSNNTFSAEEQTIHNDFSLDRNQYYHDKLGIGMQDEEARRKMAYHFIEGLQWVLLYYYRGVPSWGWFYPYHYTPKISDLVNITDFVFDFDLGSPFLPFEQLMSVLPGRSKALLPTALHPLFDTGSPIIDFYPNEFELDMNGKKAEWEAIVKIPFIDEKRLLSALRPRYKLLTDEETSRNVKGTPFVFEFDAEMNETTYPSVLPGVFADVMRCRVRMSPYILPELGPKGYRQALCPGAYTGKDLLPGFPSLKTVPHTGALGLHQVNVFNAPSNSESMVLTINDVYEGENVDDVAMRLLGSHVFIRWPFLREGVVTHLSDSLFVYSVDSDGGDSVGKRALQRSQLVKKPHDDATQCDFVEFGERAQSHYSTRFGTIIGDVSIVVYVRPVQGMCLLHDGSVSKKYAPEPIGVAIQVIVTGSQYEDPRLRNQPVPPLEEELPLDSTVFLLSGKYYGLPAKIVGHHPDTNRVDILMDVSVHDVNASRSEGKHNIRRFANTIVYMDSLMPYYPSWQVARQLDMAPLALSKITSRMDVLSTITHSRFDIGLNLKFDARGIKVPGYSRKGERGWEFSESAVTLLKEYRREFPGLFKGINRKTDGDVLLDTDLFPADQLVEKAAAVKEWLDKKGVRKFSRAPLSSVALSSDCIGLIATTTDHMREKGPLYANHDAILDKTNTSHLVQVRDVPRHGVLKPSHAKFRLLHQTFELGDRVCNVVDYYTSISLAATATVVGIDSDTWLELLLDDVIMGGGDLNGRCPPGRGTMVHKATCLNLTHIQSPLKVNTERDRTPVVAERPAGYYGKFSGANGAVPAKSNAWSAPLGGDRGPRNQQQQPPQQVHQRQIQQRQQQQQQQQQQPQQQQPQQKTNWRSNHSGIGAGSEPLQPQEKLQQIIKQKTPQQQQQQPLPQPAVGWASMAENTSNRGLAHPPQAQGQPSTDQHAGNLQSPQQPRQRQQRYQQRTISTSGQSLNVDERLHDMTEALKSRLHIGGGGPPRQDSSVMQSSQFGAPSHKRQHPLYQPMPMPMGAPMPMPMGAPMPMPMGMPMPAPMNMPLPLGPMGLNEPSVNVDASIQLQSMLGIGGETRSTSNQPQHQQQYTQQMPAAGEETGRGGGRVSGRGLYRGNNRGAYRGNTRGADRGAYRGANRGTHRGGGRGGAGRGSDQSSSTQES